MIDYGALLANPASKKALAAIFALVGGSIGSWLTDFFLKPMRDRRLAADVLSQELSVNIKTLATAFVSAESHSLPMDFRLSTSMYESLGNTIVSLPSSLGVKTMALYGFFDMLNQCPGQYQAKLAEFRALALEQRGDGPSALLRAVDEEISALIANFNYSVRQAIELLDVIQPRLVKYSRPWWFVPAWFDDQPRTISIQDHMAEVRTQLLARAAYATTVAEGTHVGATTLNRDSP